mmetsp:Transcript_12747/g.35888  ORF Transcript_12747/g.35888 Transcript_12747/m.35888 type:complete len:225 (-) Transcript_12747:810-1484(-)
MWLSLQLRSHASDRSEECPLTRIPQAAHALFTSPGASRCRSVRTLLLLLGVQGPAGRAGQSATSLLVLGERGHGHRLDHEGLLHHHHHFLVMPRSPAADLYLRSELLAIPTAARSQRQQRQGQYSPRREVGAEGGHHLGLLFKQPVPDDRSVRHVALRERILWHRPRLEVTLLSTAAVGQRSSSQRRCTLDGEAPLGLPVRPPHHRLLASGRHARPLPEIIAFS